MLQLLVAQKEEEGGTHLAGSRAEGQWPDGALLDRGREHDSRGEGDIPGDVERDDGAGVRPV
jgi:hypothetical protein